MYLLSVRVCRLSSPVDCTSYEAGIMSLFFKPLKSQCLEKLLAQSSHLIYICRINKQQNILLVISQLGILYSYNLLHSTDLSFSRPYPSVSASPVGMDMMSI